MRKTPGSRILLAGCPNVGKTSLFNSLTGSRQKVANYPGVTVEVKEGLLNLEGQEVTLVDLPGTYSMRPKSRDEEVALREIFEKNRESTKLIVAVCDATSLKRSLSLVFELLRLGYPVLVALNVSDLARNRGLVLDLKALEAELGAPVVETIGLSKMGVQSLQEGIKRLLASEGSWTGKEEEPITRAERALLVDQVLDRCVKRPLERDEATARLDRLLLHPFLGTALFGAVVFLMFQAVFSWAEAPMTWIEEGFSWVGSVLSAILPAGLIQSLLVDGLIAGVGSVLVFLPQILLLFLFILVLEKSGYMARGAFLVHRVMGWSGLQGQSFVPLLSSFACAVPGILATRSIRDPRQRVLTMMTAPLMTCSARLPVYVLLIGAFIPAEASVGPFGLQGLVMFSLFSFAILFGMLTVRVFAALNAAPKAAYPNFVMELPGFKAPKWSHIFGDLWLKTRAFLKRAGTAILLVSLVLWVLSSFPKPTDEERADFPNKTDIEFSYAGKIGAAIEPIFAPLGFDWRISAGLIPGFAAREVMVSALGTVFAVEDAEERGMALLQRKISSTWGLPTGLALLMWYVFSPQCLATFAVMRKESASWRWTLTSFVYLLGMAYVSAFLVFQVATMMSAAR